MLLYNINVITNDGTFNCNQELKELMNFKNWNQKIFENFNS